VQLSDKNLQDDEHAYVMQAPETATVLSTRFEYTKEVGIKSEIGGLK
jgi:hypothetical protein